MIQSPVVPETKRSVMAVVVTGGKQYRVAAGDHILVGRLKDDIGTELKLDRVLMHDDGSTLHIGNPTVADLAVTVKVMRHSRGPSIDVLRYKSKKRVRVHKGARADYTALEILAIGDHRAEARPKSQSRSPKAPAEAAASKAPRSRKAVAKPAAEKS